MLPGVFQRKLRALNPRLRIYGTDDAKPAGLYVVADNELVHVCGVDRQWVPENIEYDEVGHIVRSGWRRVLSILVASRLVDRRRAEKVFERHLDRAMTPPPTYINPVEKAIHDALDLQRSKGKEYLTTQQTSDLAPLIRATKSDYVLEREDRLRHWAKRKGLKRL